MVNLILKVYSHSRFGSHRSSAKGYFKVLIVGDTTFQHSQITKDPNEYQFVRKLKINRSNTQLDIEEVLKLTQLTHLDLSALKMLPSNLSSLRNLRSLNLWDNNLTEPPAGLEKLTKLENLNVRRNSLNSYSFLTLLTNLKELNLAQPEYQAFLLKYLSLGN